MVSFGIMTETTQINVRLSDQLLGSANDYVQKHGFDSVQELIKSILREKLFEKPLITPEELILVKRLAEATQKKGLFRTEEELFQKLRRK